MNLTQGSQRKPRGLGVDVGRKENHYVFYFIKVCFYYTVFKHSNTEVKMDLLPAGKKRKEME